MRLAHKRNLQFKKKKLKTTQVLKQEVVKQTKTSKVKAEKVKAVKPKAEKPKVAPKAEMASKEVQLTPKQQQVFDIISAHSDGISPKEIGLKAGQEDSKATAWATGGLKKLLEENLVIKEQAEGNKVSYKLA